MKTLLASIDEATFNNVFAVSLNEMQELATLSDTQAADVLYNITAGLDRVSLIEVTRDLETTRNQILDQHGGPSQITQLMNQREQIRRQIEEQQSHAHAYVRLAGDRGVLERELSRLEEEKEELRQQLDLRDLAAAVRDRWHRQRALGEELSSLGPQIAVPADAVERLEAIKQRATKHQAGMERLQRHRQALRREAEELNVNEALGRHGARITATLEQEPWLRALESQIAELEKQRQRPERHDVRRVREDGAGQTGQARPLAAFFAAGPLAASQSGPPYARVPEEVQGLPGARPRKPTRRPPASTNK